MIVINKYKNQRLMSGLKWEEWIPLREKSIDEYIPSTEQIIEYAQYIGLQIPGDEDLLYIAEQGIKANLPKEWQACQNISGKMVYRNIITKQIQEEHPLDLLYQSKVYQIKNHRLSAYSDVQFDLHQNKQILPSIQQERNDLSESNHSEKDEEIISKALNLKSLTKNQNAQNESSFFYQYKSLLANNKSKDLSSVNRLNQFSQQAFSLFHSNNSSSIQQNNQCFQKIESSQSKSNKNQISLSKKNISRATNQQNKVQNSSKVQQMKKKLKMHRRNIEQKKLYQHEIIKQRQTRLISNFHNDSKQGSQLSDMNYQHQNLQDQIKEHIQINTFQQNAHQKNKNQNKIKSLQLQLSHYQSQKITKLNLLNQIKQNNRLKTFLIRNNVISINNHFIKSKKGKSFLKQIQYLLQS